MLDLAVCVALGEDWLGRETTQGPVLIIDEESGVRRLNRRLLKILNAHEAGTATPLWYTSLEMVNMRESGDVRAIDELMNEIRPILVIIDALADVMPGGDENAVSDTHPVFQALRGLADKYEATIPVIHHANKAGGYRGSTAIFGAVDMMLMVESQDGESVITFRTTKIRDAEPQRFSANITFSEDKVSLSEALPPTTLQQRSTARNHVIQYLQDHGRSQLSIIMMSAATCAPISVKHAITAMAKEGTVFRCDNGKRGTAAEYDLAPRGGGNE
jgi:hypothetical protein